jgi:transposase
MRHIDTLFPLPERTETVKQPIPACAKRRIKTPVRNQVKMTSQCIDDFIDENHKARHIWRYVQQLDFSEIMETIKSVESEPGAPAIDPRLLMSLWLYGFVEGIVSAKVINRYCTEHMGFMWLCGDVSVNEHTISDFRTKHAEAFDDLLTQSIAVLTHNGLVEVEKVAQDGMKVEAHAGTSSFRRKATLEEHLAEAEEHVDMLKKEFAENPSSMSKKQAAAKIRAAKEAVQKTTQAIEELHKLRQQKAAEAKRKGRSFTQKDKESVRASKTDPQARIMKMPNSGFAPAYNIQFASDPKSKMIVGVKVIQAGHDYGQLGKMQEQIHKRLGYTPKMTLADPGFLDYQDVQQVSKTSQVYIPGETIKTEKNPTMTEIKNRMETEEAKEIYKDRAATAEFVNARTRTRGLTQFLVTGLAKVQVVATFFAIGNNMLIWLGRQ